MMFLVLFFGSNIMLYSVTLKGESGPAFLFSSLALAFFGVSVVLWIINNQLKHMQRRSEHSMQSETLV